jgi:hypothetical protein
MFHFFLFSVIPTYAVIASKTNYLKWSIKVAYRYGISPLMSFQARYIISSIYHTSASRLNLDSAVISLMYNRNKLLCPHITFKCKRKICPCAYLSTTPWRHWGSGGVPPRILDLGIRWRWVVTFTPRSLYPQGKCPRYPLDRSLDGPQSRYGHGGEEKNSQPPSGQEQ